MTLVPVNTNPRNPFRGQNLLDRGRPAQKGNEKIRRCRIAIDDGTPHQIADRRVITRFANELGQRLHVKAEIPGSNGDHVLEPPSASINGIENGHPRDEFHDALKRKPVIRMHASCSRAGLCARTNPPIELIHRCRESLLDASDVQVTREHISRGN